jgi:hypothetical protein
MNIKFESGKPWYRAARGDYPYTCKEDELALSDAVCPVHVVSINGTRLGWVCDATLTPLVGDMRDLYSVQLMAQGIAVALNVAIETEEWREAYLPVMVADANRNYDEQEMEKENG